MASKEVEGETVTKEKGAKSDPPKGKAHRGAPRGKKSWRIKDDKFRERVGVKALAEHRAKIEERTFAELDIVMDQLTNLCLTAEPVTVQLPTTTRAFGLLVRLSYTMATSLMRNPPELTINEFYRVALAQMHLQMIKAGYEKKGQMSVDRVDAQDIQSPFFNFDQMVVSHPATLKALSAVIDTIGACEFQGIRYHPVIPHSGLMFDVAVTGPPAKSARKEGDTSVAASTSGDAHAMCIRGRGPDPFTVTFTNLRATVVNLSNPQFNHEIREFFYNHSPIPGAMWNDQHVLLNPNDIIPPLYGAAQLHTDLLKMDAFVDRLHGKHSNLLGMCSFSGKGSIAQLTTSSVTGRVDSDTLPYIETNFCGSPYDIPNQQMILGLLSLCGENPPYPTPNKDFGIRLSSSCGRMVPAEWNQVADVLLKKHT